MFLLVQLPRSGYDIAVSILDFKLIKSKFQKVSTMYLGLIDFKLIIIEV